MAFGADAAHSAFLRSMGVLEQDIYSQARQSKSLAQNAFNRQLPVFTEQARAGAQSVLDDAETRGVLGTGTTAEAANRARTNVLMQQEIARGSMMDQLAVSDLDAARRVAELRRQAAEQELAARTRLTTGQLESGPYLG